MLDKFWCSQYNGPPCRNQLTILLQCSSFSYIVWTFAWKMFDFTLPFLLFNPCGIYIWGCCPLQWQISKLALMQLGLDTNSSPKAATTGWNLCDLEINKSCRQDPGNSLDTCSPVGRLQRPTCSPLKAPQANFYLKYSSVEEAFPVTFKIQ